MIIKCSVTIPTSLPSLPTWQFDRLKPPCREFDTCKRTFLVQILYFFHHLIRGESSPFLAFVLKTHLSKPLSAIGRPYLDGTANMRQYPQAVAMILETPFVSEE